MTQAQAGDVRQAITILGSTGSIGRSTLDVISAHPERFSVWGLAANDNVTAILEQILQFQPAIAVLRDRSAAEQLREQLKSYESSTLVQHGDEALLDVAGASDVDTVVAAIVGAAGLAPTLAAVHAGKRVLLANKESLVMAGDLFMSAIEKHKAQLLPVDSEHNAIFQCLPGGRVSLSDAGVRKILLTGSGGPFLNTDLKALHNVSPAQAIAHPNWSMGPKISVDSATMMNKGLEYIEACYLFSAEPSDIEILIHPQSIVHSMVEYIDGSVLAQMGQPDMRTPIAHCLAWPGRVSTSVPGLSFAELGELTFCTPDYERFPCLKLALDAMKAGGAMPAVLNAANEVVVDAFLKGLVRYVDIPDVVDYALQNANFSEPDELDAVIDADQQTRYLVKAYLAEHTAPATGGQNLMSSS